MKLNKSIICLLLVLSVIATVSAIESSRKAQTKKAKVYGIVEQIFGEWNKAKVQITGKSVYSFNCKIKDQKNPDNSPRGIVFDAFEETSENDRTGFIKFGTELNTQADLPRLTIDFRQIQNCLFQDNAKELTGDWRLEFDYNFNEEYGIKQQADKNLGNSLKIKMTFPGADKKKFTSFKAGLQANCLARNDQLNKLKDAAIKAGNLYNSLYYEYQNRQQSMAQQAELVVNASVVVEKVRADQQKQGLVLKSSVEANEKLLNDQLAALNAAASNKQANEKETEKVSEQLEVILRNLQNLQNSQALVKSNIVDSQSQLNEAIKLQQDTLAKQANLQKSSQALQAQTAVQEAEYQRLLKEIQDRQRRMQEEYDAKKKASKEQQALLANQSAQVSQNVANQNRTIESLQASIQARLEQSKAIDVQLVNTRSSIEALQAQIDQKRNISAQLNLQIQQYQQGIKDRNTRQQQIIDDNNAKLAVLKQKELDQINLVKNLNETARQKLVYFANQAATDISKSNDDFLKALQAIVVAADKASFRTERAARAVLQQNGHVSEISAVVSSVPEVVKAAFMRQAKNQKQFNRLARLRSQQVQQVRMQRDKLRNKLRHKLRRNHD